MQKTKFTEIYNILATSTECNRDMFSTNVEYFFEFCFLQYEKIMRFIACKSDPAELPNIDFRSMTSLKNCEVVSLIWGVFWLKLEVSFWLFAFKIINLLRV